MNKLIVFLSIASIQLSSLHAMDLDPKTTLMVYQPKKVDPQKAPPADRTLLSAINKLGNIHSSGDPTFKNLASHIKQINLLSHTSESDRMNGHLETAPNAQTRALCALLALAKEYIETTEEAEVPHCYIDARTMLRNSAIGTAAGALSGFATGHYPLTTAVAGGVIGGATAINRSTATIQPEFTPLIELTQAVLSIHSKNFPILDLHTFDTGDIFINGEVVSMHTYKSTNPMGIATTPLKIWPLDPLLNTRTKAWCTIRDLVVKTHIQQIEHASNAPDGWKVVHLKKQANGSTD